jgi:UDP-N-acetylglucosamine 2-epimerase (non-hydrolysing)
MSTVLVVLGTRPEAIKLAPVISALRERSRGMVVRVCATGQHKEMVAPVLALFRIEPDYDLALMAPDQTLGGFTASALVGMQAVLADAKPDWVVVQGDTTTAMAASLAAFYLGLNIAHVEAGLRTADKRHPFPEEVNRRFVDVVADLFFASTVGARDNLLREGAEPTAVHVTGNTVVDALMDVMRMPYDLSRGQLRQIPQGRRIVMVTAHRRESFGDGLRNICTAVRRLADERTDVQLVYPVHLNPRVREVVIPTLGGHERISLLDPLDYQSTVQLMSRSTLILTDSGGIQEEAPSLSKPVLVLRDVTERPEAVKAGCAMLVGTDPETIVRETHRLLEDEAAYASMTSVENPFGDGFASQRIANLIQWSGRIESRDDMPMVSARPARVVAV